jgi:polysaccharide export outer membrane protein
MFLAINRRIVSNKQLKVINQMKSIYMKIVASVLFIFLTAYGSVPVTQAADPENAKTSGDPVAPDTGIPADTYIVQPGDMLTIDVWKEKDLQRELMVRPDGGLDFPLIGNIDVSGKTVDQLRQEIVTKLAKYVPDPVVTLSVKQSLGNKIYVIGKVNKPGDFIVIRNTDVMQALSMAGGLNPYASANKIKILRREHGVLKTIPFKYSRVEKGEDLETNIVLQGGDVVVVP